MTILVIDNFLPNPDAVRELALSTEMLSASEIQTKTGKPNTWPGIRSSQLPEVNQEYADNVLNVIADIAKKVFFIGPDVEIRSAFQICYESDGDSWIHVDDNVKVAAILYLSPDAPVDSGTHLYTREPHQIRDTIGNVYNRLLMYSADEFHKSARYFGDNKESGRLIQVMFIS
jgi:hypothetical protein